MPTGKMKVPYSFGCELKGRDKFFVYRIISGNNFLPIYFQGIQSDSIQFLGVIKEGFITFVPNFADDTVDHFLN